MTAGLRQSPFMEVEMVLAFVDKGKDELESVQLKNLRDLKKYAESAVQVDIFLKLDDESSVVVRLTDKDVQVVRPTPIKALKGDELLGAFQRRF